MSEFTRIHTYFKPLASHPGALALSDDAALLDVSEGMQLVITKDAITESVHFIGSEDPALLAKKLLRCNLSDLAAMGAAPYIYFLAVALPEYINDSWLARFTAGLAEDQKAYGISLAGGDTIRTYGTLTLSLTALGLVPKGTALLRSGAQVGDYIYVSGTLGDAALGLTQLQNHPLLTAGHSPLIARYLLPEPRLTLGQKLRGIASACMDISDGLLQDLGHICEASGTGATIETAHLPYSPAAMEHPEATRMHAALAGGDDYELLFTVAKEKREMLTSLSEHITQIGMITDTRHITLYDAEGNTLPTEHFQGYQHP